MKLSLALLLGALAGSADARIGVDRLLPKKTDGNKCDNIEFKGNGFPSGKTLFKFNVLGRDTNKFDSGFDPQGDSAIIVPLQGKTRIDLLNGAPVDEGGDSACDACKRGSDFCILDANAVEGNAEICVADPFPESDVPCFAPYNTGSCDETAEYAIFARTVGKGSAKAGLCVVLDGAESCYVGSTGINARKATDISQQLLTVCAEGVKFGLFDEVCRDDGGNLVACDDNDESIVDGYFWEYDNDGNRRAEFRFYDAKLLNELYSPPGEDCFGATRGGAVCS